MLRYTPFDFPFLVLTSVFVARDMSTVSSPSFSHIESPTTAHQMTPLVNGSMPGLSSGILSIMRSSCVVGYFSITSFVVAKFPLFSIPTAGFEFP